LDPGFHTTRYQFISAGRCETLHRNSLILVPFREAADLVLGQLQLQRHVPDDRRKIVLALEQRCSSPAAIRKVQVSEPVIETLSCPGRCHSVEDWNCHRVWDFLGGENDET
jgi:hypothetical protein